MSTATVDADYVTPVSTRPGGVGHQLVLRRVFDAEGGEYRVCVQFREGDEPAALGLELGTLPGGRFARVRLQGEPPGVYVLIAPTFEKLADRADPDGGRPGIEFYRRRDLIDLLLPVA